VAEYVAFQGGSGESYSYMPVEGAPDLARRGGNYVLAVRQARGWRILDLGQSDDLGQKPWGGAPASAQVLVRLNISRAARERELEDLLAARNAPPTAQAMAS
jgi:hypothetical protein